MNRLNPRLLIPVGAALVVLLLWFVVLWGPQGSALSKAKKRADEATAKRETLRSQLTRLQQSRQDLPLKQAQLETLRVAIPDDPNLAQFILDTNDAASKSGIDFLSITPTPPAAGGTTATTVAGTGPGTTPNSIKIAMNVTGGYFQVLDFVNRLNRLPRIVVIDTLNITSSGGGTAPSGGTATGGGAAAPAASTGQLTVAVTARIFTTTQQPVSGSAGTPGATTGPTTPGATTTTTPGATTTTAAGGTTATTR